MAELINKWDVVNKLIDLENEFQHYKPFQGFEHAMYRKICEREIEIGKMVATDTNVGDKWISVKEERKPKGGEDTLVVVFNGYETYIDIDFFMGDRQWYLESENRKVTHWMPLPEPPKEENDE